MSRENDDTYRFVKISVRLIDNRKVMALSPPAFRLYVLSIIQCGQALTDGAAEVAALRGLSPSFYRSKRELVEADLWHEIGHKCDRCPPTPEPIGKRRFVMIHDYLVYQQSRAEVEETRAKARAAGRKGGLRKAQKERSGRYSDRYSAGQDGSPSARYDENASERYANFVAEPEVLPAKPTSQPGNGDHQSPTFAQVSQENRGQTARSTSVDGAVDNVIRPAPWWETKA